MYTQITTPKTALPQCSLNLMPFRINYTGRAALQTFFRVKPLEGTIHEGEIQNADATATHTSTRNPASSLGARFAAAFRGRAMKGVTVNLPDGYEGIVLRVDEERANDRMKRGRRRRKAEVDEDVDMEEGTDEEEEEERRTLKPTGQFSSFVLWNPDLPVDPSRDEYLRSLTEWTKLAAEIHRFEE